MSLGRHKNREQSSVLPKNFKLLFSFASFRFKFVLFPFFLFRFAWFRFRLILFLILKFLFRFEAKQAKMGGQFRYFAKKSFAMFGFSFASKRNLGTPYPQVNSAFPWHVLLDFSENVAVCRCFLQPFKIL